MPWNWDDVSKRLSKTCIGGVTGATIGGVIGAVIGGIAENQGHNCCDYIASKFSCALPSNWTGYGMTAHGRELWPSVPLSCAESYVTLPECSANIACNLPPEPSYDGYIPLAFAAIGFGIGACLGFASSYENAEGNNPAQDAEEVTPFARAISMPNASAGSDCAA